MSNGPADCSLPHHPVVYSLPQGDGEADATNSLSNSPPCEVVRWCKCYYGQINSINVKQSTLDL